MRLPRVYPILDTESLDGRAIALETAAAGAGGSLVADRNASLASCLVRSTNAICCDASTGAHRTW